MSFNFAGYARLEIPEGPVKKITRKSDGLVLWTKKYVNEVLRSKESDGVTIYNGGLGYKDDYRVRSGGAEDISGNSACTGFISAKAGDVVCVKDAKNISIYEPGATGPAINYSDSGRNNIGQTAGNGTYGIALNNPPFTDMVTIGDDNSWTFTVINNADIRYIRITITTRHGAVGKNLIVTVNEEIV